MPITEKIQRQNCDILFAGWGASACILLIEMANKNLLENKNIVIIDPDSKLENDKTFCFWTKYSERLYIDYASIISHEWSSIKINDAPLQSIDPLAYCHINSADLYALCRQLMDQHSIEHIQESIESVSSGKRNEIKTNKSSYSSEWLFDARPPKLNTVDKRFFIYQSFVGFKVSLASQKFDSNVYHMMDFRVDQQKVTQFVYILPYDEQNALVELTRFGKELIDKEEAKKLLDTYILEHYGEYEVSAVEKGVIPMGTIPSQKKSGKRHVEIGTRAGNVKPSTGYAFKNMYTHAQAICADSDLQNAPSKPKSRFVFYDQLLLIILTLWPHKGKLIFEQLFQSQSSRFVLRFLDEKTNLRSELKMFLALPIVPFLRATVVWTFWKLADKWILLLLIAYAMIAPNNYAESQVFLTDFELGLFVCGLFLVGIPHGALDHLALGIKGKKTISIKFILTYLSIMFGVFLTWYFLPVTWLLLFLAYSAWHFGQTDIENWNIKSPIIGFVWGAFLLAFMLLSHPLELNFVLSILDISSLPVNPDFMAYLPFSLLLPAGYAIRKRRWNLLLIVLYLFVAQHISLILAFGLYFIFHHSLLGWNNLKETLNMSHTNMFVLSLPFNIGAVLMFLLFFLKSTNTVEFNTVFFLVFLSCISLPHIMCMDRFYRKKTRTNNTI